MKRQVFAKQISGKNLYLEYVFKSLKTQRLKKKKKDPIRKWAKGMKRHFTKEDLELASMLL